MLSYATYEDVIFHGGANSLEVVLKLTERCNLACSYCYYYFSGNESYKTRPALLKPDILDKFLVFLKQGIQDLNLSTIRIDFHGGEPMLVKPESFRETCEKIKSVVGPDIFLHFGMQTNGTLVTPEWVDALSDYNVSIGISIDGPPDVHDKFRVDHQGKPSHHKTAEGIKLLHEAVEQGRLEKFGALCVLEPNNDAGLVYDHLVNDLKITDMNFLLPDSGTTIFDSSKADLLNQSISNLIDRWRAGRDEGVVVNLLEMGYRAITSGQRPDSDMTHFARLKSFIITVYSDGSVGALDELLSVAPHLFETGLNVGTHSLADVVRHPDFKSFMIESTSMPKDCDKCCWRNACYGGQEVNRYTPENGFNGNSRHCDSLASLYATLARDAISIDEVSLQTMVTSLGLRPGEL